MRSRDSAGLIELLELAESRVAPVPTTSPIELPQKSKEASLDPRLIKSLGHPVRVRALEVLNTKVASPSELAKELGEPLGNVAYHIKILEENGAIELVRTAPVRGALEHFYRASVSTQIVETPLELDQQGFDDIAALVGSIVERAKEIQEQSAARLASASAGKRETHATALMVMHVRRDNGAG